MDLNDLKGMGVRLTIKPLIISASGRGGSTWVQDGLAYANGLPTLFEPFKRELVKGAKEYAFKFVRHDELDEGLRKFLDGVVYQEEGRLWCKFRMNHRHLWHGWHVFRDKEKFKRQTRKQIELAEKYFRYRKQPLGVPVMKFIRANLMIGWLKEQYKSPTFILLRHPGAVVESKERLLTWSSEFALDRIYEDERLREEELNGIHLPSRSCMSPEGLFALQWCLETRVALRQAFRCHIPVIFYEHLVANPNYEWRRAANALGLERVPDNDFLKRPSQQALKVEERVSYDMSFLNRWKKRLSPAVIDEIQAMLDLFEVDVYSMQSALPVLSHLPTEYVSLVGEEWSFNEHK